MPSTNVATVTKRPTLTQKYTHLAETLEAVQNDRERLEEALSQAVLMLRQEDIGWAMPGGDGVYRGLTLLELQKWSSQIRTSLSGTATKAPNPHMRNGLMLRHSFVWQGGIHYSDVPGSKDVEATQGKTNVHKIIHSAGNQRLIFGKSARRKREHALYADGLYLVVGNNKDKEDIHPVPLHEITETMRDDLYEDEIIAYRWTRNEAERDGQRTKAYPNGALTGGRTEKSYWVYVDWYKGPKPDKIVFGNGQEDVLKNHTAFDLHANRPDGAAFGSPDSIAALVWARIIRDLIMNGVKMQDALAMFAFKVTAPTRAGQQTAALELGTPSAAGSAATLGGDQDLVPLNSAGKGYDFGSIGFVVATMAASLHVSGIALSANTALAGSSYGAAKTLDLPGRMAMETRRAEHIEFDERLLKWMGASDAEAYFDNYDDSTDEYRAVQAAMLLWSSGNMTPEAFKEAVEDIYGHDLIGKIPAGAINPATMTKADKKAAADTAAAAAAAPTIAPGGKPAPNAVATKTTPAANQGKSTGAGNAGHANDVPVKTK